MSHNNKRGAKPNHLDSASRQRDLTALAEGEVLDVLIVGLGATGAGAALDAASRGLRVAAIDAHDLAFGTSRWSSKMIHGGLRYIAKLELGIAYESAVERHILMTRTAPHLIRALPMLWPRSGTPAVTALTAAAIAGGDLLRMAAGTPQRVLPRPRPVGAAETRALAPGLRGGLHGGIVSWDGQLCDDARLVIGLARAAAAEGARIITRCRALAIAGDGAEVRDELTGSTFEIRARAVVNATGVWAGTLAPGVEVRPSLGTHIILPPDALGGLTVGLMVPIPGTIGRAVMALPQPDGLVYAGLTDRPLDGPVPDVPQPPEADIAFLLDVLNTMLDRPLRRADVLGAYAGLRPLLSSRSGRSGRSGRRRQDSGNDTDTADLSRRHALLTGPDGVLTIVGGKLTTYRRMAADAIDAVLRRTGLPAAPCRTRQLPLPGAGSPQRLAQVPAPRRLVARYGTEAPQVLAEAANQPWLLEPIADTSPVLGAELLWAIRHEGALDIDDLLDRRTRIGLIAADRAAALPTANRVLSFARATP